MKLSLRAAIAAVSIAYVAPLAANAEERVSIPSVVVTVENSAPERGALLTPVWIGTHDGTFDIYDRNVPLGSGALVSRESVERLAEDGNTGPISAEFSSTAVGTAQATLVGNAGPLPPQSTVSTTLNLDPTVDRYFSYSSMVIPSNDAFIANGNPLAHKVFDESGNFVAENFVVAGSEVLDAGTEANDEIAANTAFLNQGGPNIGVEEFEPVILHPGFLTEGVSFPDGVLSHPVFGNAQFTGPTYRAASFKFRFVDLGRAQRYSGALSPDQEVIGAAVQSDASGDVFAVSRRGEVVAVRFVTRDLSGPAVMVHLHNAAAGANGPVVVNLTNDLTASSRRGRSVITAADVVGPLAESADPLLSLLNEMAAGRIYMNVHTAANPAGEVRGQLSLND
ncbi:MAG: spondin domain-containing protein [Pseudomonadota bacterium]